MIRTALIVAFLTIANTVSFAQQYVSFKDARDGRVYKTVKIGNQAWMAENLSVSIFRNGDPIPQAKTNQEWIKAGDNKQPAWCYYENDPANGAKYGKLYNWYAVIDPRGLAPVGYHIPSDAEWEKLVDYLEPDPGTKMKSKSGWDSYTTGGSKTCPNCVNWNDEYKRKVPCHTCKDTRSIPEQKIPKSGNGTNSIGFSGVPDGFRHDGGPFGGIGEYGSWWGSTEGSTRNAWSRNLSCAAGVVFRYGDDKGRGFSVRCLRD